jgi:hypothetical protein
MLAQTFKVVLIGLLLIGIQVSTADAISNKGNKASYCRSILTSQQFAVETERNIYMLNSINQYIKL